MQTWLWRAREPERGFLLKYGYLRDQMKVGEFFKPIFIYIFFARVLALAAALFS